MLFEQNGDDGIFDTDESTGLALQREQRVYDAHARYVTRTTRDLQRGGH